MQYSDKNKKLIENHLISLLMLQIKVYIVKTVSKV